MTMQGSEKMLIALCTMKFTIYLYVKNKLAKYMNSQT